MRTLFVGLDAVMAAANFYVFARDTSQWLNLLVGVFCAAVAVGLLVQEARA